MSEPFPDKSVARLAAMLQALSDPTRLRILNLLAAGPMCVCDIIELLEVPQPTISRHLGQLRKSGLVEARRRWKWMNYRLAPSGMELPKELTALLETGLPQIPTLERERALAAGRAEYRREHPCGSTEHAEAHQPSDD